jgi:hypothetical protein
LAAAARFSAFVESFGNLPAAPVAAAVTHILRVACGPANTLGYSPPELRLVCIFMQVPLASH